MRELDRLTRYAKDKVHGTETPLNLYWQAQRRKDVMDTLGTVIIASIVMVLSTAQFASKATIQSPSIKNYIQQELVASMVTP